MSDQRSDDELVRMAGEAAYGVSGGNAGMEGYRAQARLTVRLKDSMVAAADAIREQTAAIEEQTAQSAASVEKLRLYTWWLIVLTIVVAVVGIAGAVIAALK